MKRFRWLIIIVVFLAATGGGVWMVGHHHVQVTVPEERWQSEVLSMFGEDQATEIGDKDLSKELGIGMKVSQPVFEKDPEPDRLRLRVNFNLNLGPDTESVRGHVAIRTKLRLQRHPDQVVLSEVEMTDFGLDGDAAKYADAARPAVQELLKTELEGYPAFRLPKEGPWWQRAGQRLLQDVGVRDGQIMVEVGW